MKSPARRTNARLLNVILPVLLLVGLSGGATARQMPVRDVSKESARTSRQWVRDGVVYEIFPRAFSDAGNFNGITGQLDRLRDLGVTILWLMPVHPIGQEKKKGTIGSPYAVRDYYAINPDYGTKEDLKRLIAEAHRRGMKVIIDIVANHTAWDSVMMKTPDFYTRDASGKILPPDPGWIDVADLNYANPRLRDYMLEMLKFWLREYDLDGFRCDVAWFVPTDFWEQARTELEKIKPDIMLLAESDEPEHLVRAFDLDYAWPFFHAVEDVVWGKRPATHLREIWERERARQPRGAMQLRFTDNHDERRAVARLGERGSMAATVLTLTLDGVPLIYNGMEVGDTMESGDPALFEKFPIFWPVVKRNPTLPVFYRQLLALRRTHAALRQGEVQWLRNNGESRVATYLRRDAREEFLIAVNFSNQPFLGLVEAGGASAPFVEVTLDVNNSSELEPKERASALPALSLDAWGYRIFRRTTR